MWPSLPFRHGHDICEGERLYGVGEWAWAASICPLVGAWRCGAVQCVLQRTGGFDPHRQRGCLHHGLPGGAPVPPP